MTQPHLISDQDRWEQVARRLSGWAELAIDTEANSMYAYRGRICLIQIASGESVYLLDPLAVSDLSSLGSILSNPSITKVMHGSDYDLRSFNREYGFEVNGLFDTETSARFLGMVSPNLAAVLLHFLDVEIPKSRRLQRSNWGLRPLSGEAVTYAAADVQHLIHLAHKQRLLLQESGRLEWVEEEFTRLEATGRAAAELPAPDFLRVKGSDRLNPQQLAVLKELFNLREAEAERVDQPPYRVMGNDVLLHLAANPFTPLDRVPGLSPHLARRLGAKMRAGIQRAIRGPGIQRPARPRRVPPAREVQARQQKLKQWRSDKGTALALDPALIWPAASLDRLAHDPESWETEVDGIGAPEVRAWQRGQFAGELEAVLRRSD
ncbi:MAG: HRDC domain-containing protein [Chloroflexota bacterium]|nr:HRDC domain-containing protein [Chloroflexota bacterium]